MKQTETLEIYRAAVAQDGEPLGRLLQSVTQKLTSEMTRLVRLDGGADVSLSQVQMLQQMCLGPNRISDLAIRTGISKQGVGKIINALEAGRFVQSVADPDDARVRIVEHTELGLDVIRKMLAASQEIEARLVAKIGKAELVKLKTMLSSVNDLS